MLGALFERVGSEGSGMSRSSVFLPRLISFATLIGALCGAFAILLGSVGAAGMGGSLCLSGSSSIRSASHGAHHRCQFGPKRRGAAWDRHGQTADSHSSARQSAASFAAASLLGSWFPPVRRTDAAGYRTLFHPAGRRLRAEPRDSDAGEIFPAGRRRPVGRSCSAALRHQRFLGASGTLLVWAS